MDTKWWPIKLVVIKIIFTVISRLFAGLLVRETWFGLKYIFVETVFYLGFSEEVLFSFLFRMNDKMEQFVY